MAVPCTKLQITGEFLKSRTRDAIHFSRSYVSFSLAGNATNYHKLSLAYEWWARV